MRLDVSLAIDYEVYSMKHTVTLITIEYSTRIFRTAFMPWVIFVRFHYRKKKKVYYRETTNSASFGQKEMRVTFLFSF